jgi:hypothetical protein
MATEDIKLEAQQVLDDLLKERLLPFKLTAEKVISEASSKYTIRFYDSRIHSITFTMEAGKSFKDLVRAATLEQVERMSGGLNRKKPK